MEEKKLFARKATGLVREFGLLVAIMVPLANAIGVGWQLRVFQGMGWNPLPRTEYFMGIPPVTMAFFVTGIGCLLSIYAFAVVTAAMPRSGGGYIAISRLLSPLWGVIATLFQWMSVSVAYGQIAVFVMEAVLIFGGLAGLGAMGFLGSNIGLFLFGVLVIVLFSAVASMGARMTGRLLQWIFWIPVAILGVVLVLFVISTPASMDAGMQAQYGASGTAYVQQAIDTGLADAGSGNTYWGVVMGSILATYWAFIGYGSTNFIAGEVKESGRNLPRAMIAATALITLIYIIVSWLLSSAGAKAGVVQDYDLVGAVAYMVFGGGSFGDLAGIGPWMPVFAHIQGAGMGMGTLVGWLTLIFAVLWAANDIPPFILSCSRMLFAMAFDRVLPEKIANVNERYHSPVNAIVVTSIAAVLGAAGESGVFSEGGIWLGQTWKSFIDGFGLGPTNLWDAIFYASFALAAFMFPIAKPELFEKAPFRAGRGVVQVVAALAVLFNAFFLYIFIVDPRAYNLPGFLADPTFAGFAGWLATIIVAAVAIYYYFNSKSKAKTTGVDYSTIFTEIPPE